MSSRGTKVPNYVDDVADFEQFDEDEAEAGYVDTSVSQPQEDEIEQVLGHSRDEEHKDDPEDDWTRNIVRIHATLAIFVSDVASIVAFPHQMEKLLASAQHR